MILASPTRAGPQSVGSRGFASWTSARPRLTARGVRLSFSGLTELRKLDLRGTRVTGRP